MNWKRFFWLVCAVAVAAALRFYALGAQSIWVDEAGTLLNVCFPFESIAQFSFADSNSPPLYFWCVAPFTQLFGPTEFGVRFFSALCGTLSVPLFYLLVLRLGQGKTWPRKISTGTEREGDQGGRSAGGGKNLNALERVALFAAWLLALNPLHLWFSQEARCYSFLLCLSLWAWLLFLRAMASQRTLIWLGFFGVVIAAIGTHLTAPILLLVCWGLWGGRMVGSFEWSSKKKRVCLPRGGVRSLGWLSVISSLSAVLWAGFVFYIQRVSHNSPPARPFSILDVGYTFFAFLGGYSFGPAVRELQQLGGSALSRHLPQVLVGLAVLSSIGLLLLRQCLRFAMRFRALVRSQNHEMTQTARWIVPRRGLGPAPLKSVILWGAAAVMTGLPIAFSVAIALGSSHPYNVRFVLSALLGFLLALSLLLQRVPRWGALGLGLVLLGVSLWADVQWFTVPRYGKDDVRAAVQSVLSRRPDAEKWLVAPGYMADSFYYALYRQGRTAQIVPVTQVSDVLEHADADVLLVSRPHHLADPQALLRGFAAANLDRSLVPLEVPGVKGVLADRRAAECLRPVPLGKKMGCFPGDPLTHNAGKKRDVHPAPSGFSAEDVGH